MQYDFLRIANIFRRGESGAESLGTEFFSIQNRRKSELRRLKNRFFAIYATQNATFRSQIADRFRWVFPHLERMLWVTPMVFRLVLGESTDTKSTEHDTKSTEYDTKSTDHDIFRSKIDTPRTSRILTYDASPPIF